MCRGGSLWKVLLQPKGLLRVCTWNAAALFLAGTGRQRKHFMVHKLCRQNDVVLLQETHCTELDFRASFPEICEAFALWASPCSALRSGGLITLVRRSLLQGVTSEWVSLLPGRVGCVQLCRGSDVANIWNTHNFGLVSEVVEAIRFAAEGKVYIHPSVARFFLHNFLHQPASESSTGAIPALTDREREVLTLVASGLTTQEIADRLFLSPHTIHRHRTSLMQKLGLHNRLELLRHCIRHGLIDAET